jgi:proteic killer suppression protein
MIESFNHKGLERLFEYGDGKLLRPDLVGRIGDLLARLDAAEAIKDLDIPSLRLHPLKGKLKGFWAITVRATGA